MERLKAAATKLHKEGIPWTSAFQLATLKMYTACLRQMPKKNHAALRLLKQEFEQVLNTLPSCPQSWPIQSPEGSGQQL